MTRRTMAASLMTTIVAPPLVARASATPSGATLMRQSHEATRFPQARFAASLVITSRSGAVQRRALAGVAKLDASMDASARLMRFTRPADMAGVGTLTVENGQSADDLWIYLPSLRRVRRLVSANRADSWVGTDFSLGDITGHKPSDWSHSAPTRVRLNGEIVWQVESTPARASVGTDTGYSKRRSFLRISDAALLRADFHGLNGQLLKSLYASDLRILDAATGKVQPMELTMVNVSGSRSVMSFSRFTINQAVRASELTPRALSA